MGVDTSIYGMIKPVEIESPVNALAKLLQVQNMQQEGQLGQAKLDEYQRGVSQQNALSKLLSTPGFDVNSEAGKAQLYGISPNAAQQFIKQNTEAQTSKAALDASTFKLAKDRHDTYMRTVGALASDPALTKDKALQAGQELINQGVLPPNWMQTAAPSMPDDPNELRMKLRQGLAAQLTPDQMITAFAPKPDKIDNGQKISFRDTNPNSPTYGQDTAGAQIQKVATPGEVMNSQNQAANRAQSERHFQADQAGAGTEVALPPDTLALMAQQYLKGDTSVMTNIGRGGQGAKNIVALRNEIAKQAKEQGLNGGDLAAINAEYFGTKAGQRTVGTRTANVEMAADEAQSVLPLARQASANVARSGLLPFGKAQIMFNDQTNDPAMRQFAAANNALVNVYARAISPSGVPTVADKEHARDILSTAHDQPSYNATLDQMEREIQAARSAPRNVRQAFSNAVTGRDSQPQATKPAAPANRPSLSSIFK